MIYFLNFYWIFFAALLLLFDIYCFHAFIVSRWGHFAPFAPTLGHQKQYILKKLENILQGSDKPLTIMDAGCGNGNLLRELAKQFPTHRFIGLEWSYPYYKYCAWLSSGYKNIKILHQDMFKYDFGGHDVILCFLIPQMAENFGNKAKKEMSEDCLIFSNGIKFPQLTLVEQSGKFSGIFPQEVYVYKKN